MWSFFFFDGFLLIFLGQNPWLLASALVLNCYFALDQPLNLFVSQLLLQEKRTIFFFRGGMCFSWSMIWRPLKQGCYGHTNLSNCSETQISHACSHVRHTNSHNVWPAFISRVFILSPLLDSKLFEDRMTF